MPSFLIVIFRNDSNKRRYHTTPGHWFQAEEGTKFPCFSQGVWAILQNGTSDFCAIRKTASPSAAGSPLTGAAAAFVEQQIVQIRPGYAGGIHIIASFAQIPSSICARRQKICRFFLTVSLFLGKISKLGFPMRQTPHPGSPKRKYAPVAQLYRAAAS